MSRDKSVDNPPDRQDTEVVHTQEYAHVRQKNEPPDRDTARDTVQTAPPSPQTSANQDLVLMYKKMLEELSRELKARQDELEGAHYRIGQLEGQIKYSVPLPEHKNEVLRLTESTLSLQAEITDKLTRLKKIREAYYFEKLNKRIYLILALALLALQPLWLYLTH